MGGINYIGCKIFFQLANIAKVFYNKFCGLCHYYRNVMQCVSYNRKSQHDMTPGISIHDNSVVAENALSFSASFLFSKKVICSFIIISHKTQTAAAVFVYLWSEKPVLSLQGSLSTKRRSSDVKTVDALPDGTVVETKEVCQDMCNSEQLRGWIYLVIGLLDMLR